MTKEYIAMKDAISKLLVPLGFIEEKPDTESDSTGSMYCIYVLNKKRILIEWNTEDEIGAAAYWTKEGIWKTITPEIIKTTEHEFKSKINSMCQSIVTHLQQNE